MAALWGRTRPIRVADAAAEDLDAHLARLGRRDLNRLFDEVGALGPHDHSLAKWRGSERGQYMMTKTREGEQRSSETLHILCRTLHVITPGSADIVLCAREPGNEMGMSIDEGVALSAAVCRLPTNTEIHSNLHSRRLILLDCSARLLPVANRTSSGGAECLSHTTLQI